ncbi:hypothetical protein BJV78DRAFT_960689 [Lactifluus subvellereus]|nr:hypothetical protein BJV78DRAFT_960689 [Lactifluus subvellereus]
MFHCHLRSLFAAVHRRTILPHILVNTLKLAFYDVQRAVTGQQRRVGVGSDTVLQSRFFPSGVSSDQSFLPPNEMRPLWHVLLGAGGCDERCLGAWCHDPFQAPGETMSALSISHWWLLVIMAKVRLTRADNLKVSKTALTTKEQKGFIGGNSPQLAQALRLCCTTTPEAKSVFS